MKVKVLSAHLANIIAAGEVIERPASVVKELVENSLDAGAKVIYIHIEDCGRKLIEIDDDGDGMGEEDVRAAFIRHATSKISTSKDLFALSTLGFRGEALPSIAAVSRVAVETSDGTVGTYLEIEGSVEKKVERMRLRKGTKISISNLFYNTPARYKFLKSDYTENAHIIELVENLAMANPRVMFNLTIDGRQAIKSSGNGNLLEVISTIYGVETANNLIKIEGANFDFGAHGYISNPSISKATRSSFHFFLNKRLVRMPTMINNIINAYDTNLAPQRYPVVVLFIETDPNLIDVNVHPSKKEVKISKEKELMSLVLSLIQEAFANNVVISQAEVKESAPLPTSPSVKSNPNLIDLADMFGASSINLDRKIESVEKSIESPILTFKEEVTERSQETIKVAEPLFVVRKEKIIGQYLKTYIVYEKDGDLFLVDQHAAMERINFEKYIRQYQDELYTIGSLMPRIYTIKPSFAARFEEALPLLNKVGFSFELFGDNSYRLLSLPYFLSSLNEEQVVQELLGRIENDLSITTVPLLRNAVALISCKASLKAGDSLTMAEMTSLIDQLQQCEQPSTCPHGRPVIIQFNQNEILKAFKRSGF